MKNGQRYNFEGVITSIGMDGGFEKVYLGNVHHLEDGLDVGEQFFSYGVRFKNSKATIGDTIRSPSRINFFLGCNEEIILPKDYETLGIYCISGVRAFINQNRI